MSIDPRGPLRKILSISEFNDRTECTLSCLHVARLNQAFTYKIDASCHCYTCGEIQRNAMYADILKYAQAQADTWAHLAPEEQYEQIEAHLDSTFPHAPAGMIQDALNEVTA